ncbi:MAG: cyclin-dependent kinase inhibitor 3 family protein [Polyangiaceae bacterium]|nr:cyclin-dependent kinase inhibitor 3 family protein [Polyangiaceae bacterium]
MVLEVRTSASDPIRVDFLAGERVPLGRLGLTLAPGKRSPGLAALWHRDLDADLGRLREHYGATHLVSLLEDRELPLLGIEPLFERAEAHGLHVVRLPIPDGTAPPRPEAVRALVADIVAWLAAEDTVVVHCRGGLGRAGTIAACALVALGAGAEEAMRVVRSARPNAIENELQERFVRAFAGQPAGAPGG